MRTIVTRKGEVRVVISTTIRRDLYEKLEAYAKARFGGVLSRALDEILDIAFNVIRVVQPQTPQVVIKLETQHEAEEKTESKPKRNKKNENEEVNPVEAEVATKLAIGKLREHLGLLQSFKENLQRYIKLRKSAPSLLANLGISPPNADSISKHVDRIMKDVEKVMKDRKVVKTQELLELVDMIQKEAEEVRALLAEFMKL